MTKKVKKGNFTPQDDDVIVTLVNLEELGLQFEEIAEVMDDEYYSQPDLEKWRRENPDAVREDQYRVQDRDFNIANGRYPWDVFPDDEMNDDWRRLLLLARGQIQGPDRKAEEFLFELAKYPRLSAAWKWGKKKKPGK